MTQADVIREAMPSLADDCRAGSSPRIAKGNERRAGGWLRWPASHEQCLL